MGIALTRAADVVRHTVTITTASDGTATGYTPYVESGEVLAIRYVADGTTPYTNTVVATITCEGSGLPIVTWSSISATGQVMPRAATHDTSAAASLYAAAGQAVNGHIPVAQERIKIALASGGSVKTGVFHIYVRG